MSADDNYFKSTCDHCGVSVETPIELYNQPVQCPSCQGIFTAQPRALEAELVPPRQYAPPRDFAPIQQNGDATFFKQDGVTITKTLFISNHHTFAMSGITSVRGQEVSPERGWLIALMVVGFLLLAASAFVGFAAIIAAIVFMCLQKPTFCAVITTAGGEVTGCSSKNKLFIASVVRAVTDAIVARG
jgi:hypothetical protein